ncbi:MAG: glycogen synthase [Rhodothermales bacterium]|nr:glycogen synthase [Rhodothermales bacterium]
MHIVQLTNEYPPHVYGGAGVHIEYLTRELAALDDGAHRIDVLCFGDQDERHGNLRVRGIDPPFVPEGFDPRHRKLFDTLQRNLMMAGAAEGAAIAHGHTWYSHFAGCLVKQLTGAKLVLTTHSLEPHRPWKAEQLGTAYHASAWVERTAYENADGVIAVSPSMKDDVQALYGVPDHKIRVIPNGIDPAEYRPVSDEGVLRANGIDPAVPFVLFVGRITRQKGIIHLVRALHHLRPGTQVVLAAGAPDTEEIGREMEAAVAEACAATGLPIVWIREMLPREDVIALYAHAAVFVCPSVYEPFGIINLEAMACETAVVASAVGGIPGVVVDGETGLLVPFEARGEEDFEPRDPDAFAQALAEAVNTLLADPARRAAFGRAGRARVEAHFSWRAVARQTLDFYQALTA